MHDFVMAIGYFSMVFCPCFTAAYCASERRLIQVKSSIRRPEIERRDNR